MRANTLIMLLIALVFGGVAVFFANVWLNNQAPRQTTAAVGPAVVETSTLVVAGRDIAFGETLNAEALREIPWPKSNIPDGSFAKIADLTSDGGHVVLNPISPNEPVLKWKISGAGARASLSALIGPGMRAVAIRMNDVVGVAGFVLPGDRVDVLYTKNGSGDSSSSTDILIQNVRVLAVDQVADQKKSDPIVPKVVTIEVKPVDGEKIALAQSTGSVSLTLRAAGGVEPAPAQRVVEQELVSSPSVYQAAMDVQSAALAATDARLKSLEAEVKKTAESTGKGEEALRDKLAALESAIHDAGNSTAGADAMKAKLAEFEASLKALASASNKPIFITAVADKPPTKASVGVTRGTKRDVYDVPIEDSN